MKRLLVSAAVLPLLYAAVRPRRDQDLHRHHRAGAHLHRSPSGQPDHLTIEAAGSIAPDRGRARR